MTFTYVLSTDNGKVRLILPDNNSGDYIFEDEEIAAFLSIESGSVKKATALAIETVATQVAYTDKVTKLLDLQVDGAKTLDALLKRAKTLRDQAEDEGITDHFDYIEFSDLNEFNTEEWIVKNVSDL